MSGIESVLARVVKQGSGVWWQQGAAEAIPLVDSLVERSWSAVPTSPVRAFSGLSLNPTFADSLPEGFELTSYGAMGTLRKARARSGLRIIPCHYSALPRLFASGRIPAEVGIVQVSAPNHESMVSMAIGGDYTADALCHAPVLIAEVNHALPFNQRATTLPLSRFDAILETDRPLPGLPVAGPDDIDRAIATRVAELVPDGATLQIGVGSLPLAVLGELGDHTDLGIHSGIVTDAMIDLIEAGAITGARKQIDVGMSVAGTALGSAGLYRRLPAIDSVELKPTSYTHQPAVLAQLSSLVSVNAALEVDLAGQVNAESAGGRYLGGIGGLVDFSRAASTTGHLSIITVRSTSRDSSTIVPLLSDGLVSLGRPDADVIVTEHGTADLRGLAGDKRMKALIAVAAPEHRDGLERASPQPGR